MKVLEILTGCGRKGLYSKAKVVLDSRSLPGMNSAHPMTCLPEEFYHTRRSMRTVLDFHYGVGDDADKLPRLDVPEIG